MPVQIINTEPIIRVLAVPVPFTLWNAINTSVVPQINGANVVFSGNLRFLGVTIEKSTPFNTGVLKIGHGSVAAQRETIATGTEVDCTVSGTIELNAWRNSTDGTIVGGFNNMLAAAQRNLNLRYEGASLPTQGALTLYFHLHEVSPRTTMF